MGQTDKIMKQYTEELPVFADAFNFLIYGGRQVIRPEDLHPLDSVEVEAPYGADGAAVPAERVRDSLKYLTAMSDGSTAYVILGLENQSEIHYAMPVKALVYDAMSYAMQVREAASSHKREKDGGGHTAGEYLSGFYKEDKLIPVITLVIYFGPEEWDGPRSLHEMLAVQDEEILSLVNDYRIHLIAPGNLSDGELEKFHSSLREVLMYIKYSGEEEKLLRLMEKEPGFASLDRLAAMVISACTGSEIKMKEKEREVSMCKAIEDMKRHAREAGYAEGQVKGLKEAVTKDICKLMKNLHMTVTQAMEVLEIPEAEREELLAALGQ